jgi:anaerobic selenocysteine-containing dehydrogenase
VLPAATQYEKWEYTFFTFEFPTNYFQLRAPLFEPLPGTLPEAEIYSRLLKEMGELPPDTELESLRQLAAADRVTFGQTVRRLMSERPGLAAVAPVLLYKTLGAALPDGAANAAPLWFGCQRLAKEDPDAVRAAGIQREDLPLGEALFEKILASRSGTAFTTHTYEQVWRFVTHRDGKVHLAVPRLLKWLDSLDPDSEADDTEFPFMLIAGQRRSYNANQIIRHPGWRREDPDGALRIHPDDLETLGVSPGGWIRIATRTGDIVVRSEKDDSLRRGVVSLPHGYGQLYPDGEDRVLVGPRLNLLTASEDCDPIAATPHHKNVAVRLTAADPQSAAAAEEMSRRVRSIAAA